MSKFSFSFSFYVQVHCRVNEQTKSLAINRGQLLRVKCQSNYNHKTLKFYRMLESDTLILQYKTLGKRNTKTFETSALI